MEPVVLIFAAAVMIFLVRTVIVRNNKKAMLDEWYDEYDNWRERYHLTPNEFAWKNRISSYYYHGD